MRDLRPKYIIKLSALQRYVMWHSLSSYCNHIRIAEFPKSGGTWLGQMVADMAEVKFPRNTWMSWGRGVQHSHLPGPIGSAKTILLVRDGRDVVVSAYYHFVIGHDHSPKFLTQEWRKKLGVSDPENIKEHLPKFIELFFSKMSIGGSKLNWAQHLDSFDLDNEHLHLVKYEDLLDDCQFQLRRVADFYNLSISEVKVKEIVDQYNFKRLSNREAGQEDSSSFLRKGIAGDWKNQFTQEAMDRFNDYGLEGLRKLGYEY